MDAVEFLKTIRRICNSNKNGCTSCVVYQKYNYCKLQCVAHPEEIVAAVEKWAKEHPIKTRQSEFLKVIPNAPMRIPWDVLDVCPNEVDATQSCPTSTKPSDQTLDICYLCKKAYWLAEVD
jgi:hypothetical protein